MEPGTNGLGLKSNPEPLEMTRGQSAPNSPFTQDVEIFENYFWTKILSLEFKPLQVKIFVTDQVKNVWNAPR